jgi:formamidopyrimidine-DNA glycosylase
VPELPFLEILAENLTGRILGRRIESIAIRQPALLQTAEPAPETFAGEFVSLVRREGKYLVLETETRRALVLHLMRLGRLDVVAPEPGRARVLPKKASAVVRFDDGSELRLVEHGTEKRARLWLVEDAGDVLELASLGADPTRGGLDRAPFLALLRAESRQLKTFLTDQRAIAGIGNGLSDEILWEARLSPLALTTRLSDEDADRLREAVGRVPAEQVDRLRASAAGELPQREPSDLYAVHDQAGKPCPRCGTAIARISYAERETFYCPGCQTGGKPLKDRRLSRLLR